jgi:RNA polymerase sigma-70 factor (ECF subfamily)
MVQKQKGATDAELVRLARIGNHTAFGELVRRYENVACATALTVSGDSEAARDAAQDGFLSAYLSIGQLREPAQFGAWLRGIVRRRAADLVRRNQRLQAVPDETPDFEKESAAISMRKQARGRQGEELIAAVETLPENEREAVLVTYMGERTREQAAQYLGITATTLKGRLQQARARLKVTLLTDAGKGFSMEKAHIGAKVDEQVGKISHKEIDERIPLNGARHIVLFLGMDAEVEFCQTDGDAVVVTGVATAVGTTEADAQTALDAIHVRGDQVDDYANCGPHRHTEIKYHANNTDFDELEKRFPGPEGYTGRTWFFDGYRVETRDAQWLLPTVVAAGTSFNMAPFLDFTDVTTRENADFAEIQEALGGRVTRISVVHEGPHNAVLPMAAMNDAVRRSFRPRRRTGFTTTLSDGRDEDYGDVLGPTGCVDLVIAVPHGVLVTVIHNLEDPPAPLGKHDDLMWDLPRVRAKDLRASLNLISCHALELADIEGDLRLLDTRLDVARDIRGRVFLSDYDFGGWDLEKYPQGRSEPRRTVVERVTGNLDIDVGRLDLKVDDVRGSVNLRNRWGKTEFLLREHAAGSCYRLDADSGATRALFADEVLTPSVFGPEEFRLMTLCGTIEGTFPFPWIRLGKNGASYTRHVFLCTQGDRENACLNPVFSVTTRSGDIVYGVIR